MCTLCALKQMGSFIGIENEADKEVDPIKNGNTSNELEVIAVGLGRTGIVSILYIVFYIGLFYICYLFMCGSG